MSLRDQLLKAGLADKKKVARTNRQLKKSRKSKQAKRDSKAEQRRREEAERAAAEAERREKVAQERARLLAIREAQAKERSLRKLLRSYALPERTGTTSFWHRAPDGKTLLRMRIPESWALDLRAGRLAIAWTGPSPHLYEIVVLPAYAADRVRAQDPRRLLLYQQDPPDDDDPAEQLYGAYGEVSHAEPPELPPGHVYTPPPIRL